MAKHTIKKTSKRENWCGLCHRHNMAGAAWACEVCRIPVCLKCHDETQCQGKYARGNPGRDTEAGITMYSEFHQYAPKKQGRFPGNLEIPMEVFKVGSAEWMFYASNKWEHKQNFYMHEHGWGVGCYLTDGGDKRVEVPEKYRTVDTLVRLGECRGGPARLPSRAKDLRDNVGKTANSGKGLGFVWTGQDGVLDGAMVGSPYPELYCTPDGGCLLVIEGKKKIRALIWGGGMRVKSQGIVG